MSLEFVNPFIEATVTTISTIASLTPKKCLPEVKENKQFSIVGDVSAVLGLTGNAYGWVAISFPKSIALKIASRMLNEVKADIDADVQDAVGEIINVIAGTAKAELAQFGITFKIAIPTVIVGSGHTISQKRDVPRIAIPFEIDQERFMLELCLKRID